MTNTDTKTIPVILTIRAIQNFDGTDGDHSELMTEGTMTVTEEGFLLSYEETALTGLDGTTTTFTVKDGQVVLTRTGKVNSQMVFQEGCRHTSLYETPFGALSVDIQTSRLRCSLTERGGLLDIRYSIAIQHTATGQNAFRIRVRTKK